MSLSLSFNIFIFLIIILCFLFNFSSFILLTYFKNIELDIIIQYFSFLLFAFIYFILAFLFITWLFSFLKKKWLIKEIETEVKRIIKTKQEKIKTNRIKIIKQKDNPKQKLIPNLNFKNLYKTKYKLNSIKSINMQEVIKNQNTINLQNIQKTSKQSIKYNKLSIISYFIFLIIFTVSVLFVNFQKSFAQQENKQITYDSVTCSDFELCNKEPWATNIPQETQFFATNITNRANSQDIFNYLCKQKSKNPNAIYISHTEENWHTEPLLAFAYEISWEIKYLSVNSRPTAKKSIKTLTCEIPPTETEEEKQARLQEEERIKQERERQQREEQARQEQEKQQREREEQEREENQNKQNQEKQIITHDNITCSNFELCRNTENIDPQYKISSFVLRDLKLKSIYANNICKELTNNSNSNFIDFLEDNLSWEKVAFRYNEENQEKFVIKTSYNRYIKQITCEILPENQQNQQNQQNQNNQQTPPNEPVKQVIGCADPTAINHNSQANVHDERSCIYPTIEKPYQQKDITWYIENTQVQSWATTFNLILNLNTTWAILDISKIQIWNQFTPINSVTQDNKIIITFQKFNWQRLDVECNSYELTIPKNSITRNIEITENNQIKQITEKNSNSITGNFTVVWCKNNNQDNQNEQDSQNPNEENITTNINNAELDENKTYLPLISQKDWVFYIDIKAVAFLILFILITFSFSYVIYKLFTKKY